MARKGLQRAKLILNAQELLQQGYSCSAVHTMLGGRLGMRSIVQVAREIRANRTRGRMGFPFLYQRHRQALIEALDAYAAGDLARAQAIVRPYVSYEPTRLTFERWLRKWRRLRIPTP